MAIQIPIRTKSPPPELDVYAIRMGQATGIGYTQGSFAEAIGVSVKTVQNWEQRRRKPTGPARALLVVIAHDPVAFVNAIRMSTLGAPSWEEAAVEFGDTDPDITDRLVAG